jgi:hypothetical protein
MNLLLITLFSFLATMVLIVILFLLPMAVQSTPQARIRRRLTAVGRMNYASRGDIQNLLKTSTYSEIPVLNDILARMPIVQHIDLLLERANVDMTPALFLLLCGGSAGITIFSVKLFWLFLHAG